MDEREAGRLHAAWERGRAAWPELPLGAEAFLARLARHRPADEPLEPWLDKLHVSDLYLACACEHVIAGALEAFDRDFLSAVPAILRRTGLTMQPDEIRQRVRERLFVGAAKIADYSGRGALANWLEVVTLRIAIDAKRQEPPLASDTSAGSGARLADADPELEFIKERYRDVFKQTFRGALAELPSEQRNLLRLHFVDALTLEQMAALFKVHRATVARRIAACREAVLDGVRQRLQSELSLSRDELDSFLRLVRSRIDLSLSVLLSKQA
jgi:RNA polymerase sigma-70 factor (ECF subfamily)